jgi:hypothetical protein
VTRAPAAIRAAADRIVAAVPGAVFSGIVGDAAHVYGYHLGRDDLPSSDYSVQLGLDQQGAGDAASALDISMPTDQMVIVSHRLANAALARDPRMRGVREFAGTRDGRNVEALDIAEWVVEHGWDESHLWHVHISGYRAYVDDHAVWDDIASAFIGQDSAGAPGEPERREMIEIFTYGNGIFCWTGSSLWLAPDIGYVNALQSSLLYAGDRGVVDQFFMDAARALSNTSADDPNH